jgi:acetyl-CoA acetyltransferase
MSPRKGRTEKGGLMRDPVVVSYARTPFRGALAKVSEFDLSDAVISGAIDRSGTDRSAIDLQEFR